MQSKMNIQTIPADKLSPAAYNPRKDLKPGDAEYDKLRRSIEEFGYVEPIIWNSRTGNIIGGHQRFKILRELGYGEIECVALDMDEQREKALNVALNKISGEFDIPLLTDLLRSLDEGGFDVSLTGFDAAEMSELFGDAPADVQEDDFDAEKTAAEIEKPISRRGDIWLLGKHRLRCGDSTSQADVDLLMDGGKAKLIVTDAPYNVSYGKNNPPAKYKRRSIMNDSMPPEKFQRFLESVFACAYNAAEPGAAIYAFMSAQEWGRFMRTLEQARWHWSSTIVWVKDTLVLGRKDFQPRYEAIYYGWRDDAPRLYPLKNTRNETDVWEFDRPKKSPLHPTQKPLDVLAKAIAISSRKGDIILDLFSGSASTLIAAEQLGRTAYLQELDEKYVDVGVRRYAEFMGGTDDIFLLREGERLSYEGAGMSEAVHV